MTPPWILRSILALLVLEVGVCAAFLSEEWPPLHRRENALAHFFLGATRDNRDFVLDDSPAKQRSRFVRPLEKGVPRSYLRIDITEDPERIFEETPPSATDWAVILNNARKMGCSIAAIDHPLTWNDAGEIPLRALDYELSAFDRAVLCVDLRRDADARAEPLPPSLARHAIPLDNLTGNPGNLPRVNRTTLPTSASANSNIIFAFRLLENDTLPNAAKQQAPRLRTLALWDNLLIPSFPVALAMAQYDVSPEDVRIELGSHIRLGNGPIIPIDKFAQLLVPPVDHPQSFFTTAESLIQPGFSGQILPADTPDCALFVDATGATPSPWRSPAHLLRVVSSLDLLDHPGWIETHPRLPLWSETLLLLLLGLLSAVFLRFSPLSRALAFSLLLLGCLLLMAGLLDLSPQHSWTPLAPLLAATLAGWFLASRMSRSLP